MDSLYHLTEIVFERVWNNFNEPLSSLQTRGLLRDKSNAINQAENFLSSPIKESLFKEKILNYSYNMDNSPHHSIEIGFESTWNNVNEPAVLVLGLFEGGEFLGGAGALDEQTGNFLSSSVKESLFKGKIEESIFLYTPGKIHNNDNIVAVLVVGLGTQGDLNSLNLEKVGATIYNTLKNCKTETAIMFAESLQQEFIARIAYGAVLASYSFDKYKSKEGVKDGIPIYAQKKLILAYPNKEAMQQEFENLKSLVKGVFTCRNFVTEPSNAKFPEQYASWIKESLRPYERLKVEVLDEKAMQKLNMNALLGVGQGSIYPSRLVVIKWQGGEKNDPPVAFVGKGVTFDTGGISIKPADFMWDMKYDMAGSAALVGLFQVLAERNAKVNAVAVLPIVENAVSGSAQRPGDVVVSMSKKTIEVLNTDAEGRLILADAMWFAQEQLNPKCVITIATLTGAIIIALGDQYAGLFSNNDMMANQLTSAGLLSGERVWRFPLGEEYDNQINSDIADVKNISLKRREAGSIIAAQFLQRFVKDKLPWAHLDIAGVAWKNEGVGIYPRGASGFGVRLLDDFIKQYETK